MNDLIRSLGSTTPSASARKKQHVLDVDFSDPQTVRLNSPRGRLPASLGDGDALAAKLRDSKRLRTLQTMGSALRAERPQQPAAADPRTGLGSSWRVLDFSSSSADLGKSVASESNEKSQDAQVAGNDPRQTSQIGGWMSAPSQLTKSSKLWSRPTGRSLKDESSLGPKFAEPKVYTRGPPKTARLQVKRSQAAPSKYSSPYSFAQQSPKTPRTPIGTRRPATVGSKSSIPRLHVCPDGLFTAGYQPIPALMFSPQPRRTVAEDIVATKRLHTPQSSRKITLHSPLTRKMCNAPDLCADAAEGAERAEHLGRVARKYLRPNGNLADMSLSTDGENQHDQHVEDGNIDEDDSAHAITLLHSGTAHSPLPGVDGSTDESPHGLIQQSLMYALAGQFEEALKCAQEAANILPEDPMVWMRLGKAYQGLGQWAEAETAILRGLELDPTEETLHSSHKEIKVSLLKERGQQHMKAGLPDKAITAFSEALEFANETDKCWLMNQRSRLYFSKQDFVSAAEDAGACVKLNPDLMEAYERHCDSLIAMGDFESAKVTAQNGLQHAPNLKNQVLDNCLERLATGALPKTSTARVFVKQVLKQETCEELSRILSLWDKTLRVEMHHRVMTLWKAQVKLKNTSNKVPLPSPLAALKNAATTVSKNASFLGHLSKRVSAADLQTLGNFTQSSNSLAENSMDPSFSPMDFNTSFRSISRTSSTFSMGSQVDGRDLVQKIMDVCKECFKCSLSKNRSLFLDMAIFGWRQALTAIDFEDKKELAGINLQLGFALLEKVQGGESIEEERLCIETLQKAIDLLQDGEVAAQRVAAQVGLAQIYQIRQEGDRVDNLLEAAAQLQNTLSFCTYDEDPHRFIAVHHEIGDVYGAAGQWTLATLFLSSALKLLEEPGCTSWNTLSGIKFLRAVTHCKLAEVVIAANDDLDPENDPRFQLNISKAIEHYEFALQVFVLHHYPMDYSRTVARLCHLRGMSGSNSIFANNGIVCLHQGQRTKLLHAYKGFQDALATAEAIAITLFTRDDERLAVNAEDILSIVAQCFSGCIQMSIRLGMYAQALGYSERAHAYPILKELLQEPCRQELFEGLPAHMLTRFNELSKNLSQYRTALAIDVPSSSNFSGMLSEAVQMLKLLEDMAAYTEICSNEKLRLLGMIIPKVREVPCVFLEDPVQDCETAVVEFFWNPSCFYVFVQCWKEDCPKTIEYTAKQIKIITENVDALQLPGAKDPEYAKSMRSKRKESAADGKDGDFMRSLEAISKALKIDTVLKAVPSCVRRLIIVPHGKLMAVPIHLLPVGVTKNIFEVPSQAISGAEAQTDGFSKLSNPLSWSDQLLMDRYPMGVFYAPSIKMLSWLQERPIEVRFAPMLSCLSVGRPSGIDIVPVPAKDVYDGEIRCFRQIFKKMRGLQGLEASEYLITQDPKEQASLQSSDKETKSMDKTAVTSHSADILHFSCYSVVRTDGLCDRMELHLRLAGKDSSSLASVLDGRQVASWQLPVCRVVTLASNELIKEKRQNAVRKRIDQGLGSAGPSVCWLLAGSCTVVWSAWYVDDECKIVFFCKFYETMTQAGLDVAEALLSTQRWLRSATQCEYMRAWPKEWQSISWTERIEELEEEERELREEGKEPARPFASPFWWAGYSLWGDGNVSGKHAQDKAKKEGGYNYDKFIEDYVGTNEDGDAQKEEDNDTLPDKPQLKTMTTFVEGLALGKNLFRTDSS